MSEFCISKQPSPGTHVEFLDKDKKRNGFWVFNPSQMGWRELCGHTPSSAFWRALETSQND